jgi:hypothetical protein
MRDDVSAMEYLSLMHAFWSGDIVMRIEVVSTGQHSGMLFLGVHYGVYDLDEVNNQPIGTVTGQYGAYIDCHIQNEFTYVIDFRSSTPALNGYRVPYPRVTDTLGVWTLDIVNPLAVQGLVSSIVDVNIYFAAGPNFKVHYPRPFRNMTAITGESWSPTPQPPPLPFFSQLEGVSTFLIVTDTVLEIKNSTTRTPSAVMTNFGSPVVAAGGEKWFNWDLNGLNPTASDYSMFVFSITNDAHTWSVADVSLNGTSLASSDIKSLPNSTTNPISVSSIVGRFKPSGVTAELRFHCSLNTVESSTTTCFLSI